MLGISGLNKMKQILFLLGGTICCAPWASLYILAGSASAAGPWSFLCYFSCLCYSEQPSKQASLRKGVKSPSGTGTDLLEKGGVPKLRGDFLAFIDASLSVVCYATHDSHHLNYSFSKLYSSWKAPIKMQTCYLEVWHKNILMACEYID